MQLVIDCTVAMNELHGMAVPGDSVSESRPLNRSARPNIAIFQALRHLLCAVLLCGLSVDDSSPPKDTVVSGQWSVVSCQCT